VPTAYLQEYVEVATQYDEVYLKVLPNAGHFELIYPNTSTWTAVRNAIKALLDRDAGYKYRWNHRRKPKTN
jgi:hypothetical protein